MPRATPTTRSSTADPLTHDDPARAVAAGVATLLARDAVPAADFTRVVHATTLFTNALIERRYAEVFR